MLNPIFGTYVEADAESKSTEYQAEQFSEPTFDHVTEESRQISDDLWITFRGFFSPMPEGGRWGMCEYYLSRVKNPQTADYVRARKVSIFCVAGDLGPGANRWYSSRHAVGILYPEKLRAPNGERFILRARTEDPNIPEQEFSY